MSSMPFLFGLRLNTALRSLIGQSQSETISYIGRITGVEETLVITCSHAGRSCPLLHSCVGNEGDLKLRTSSHTTTDSRHLEEATSGRTYCGAVPSVQVPEHRSTSIQTYSLG